MAVDTERPTLAEYMATVQRLAELIDERFRALEERIARLEEHLDERIDEVIG